MNYYTSEKDMNLRGIDRSLYRNMPSKCIYCAYMSRPSSYGTMCTMCSISKDKIEMK